jgi:hypothetical protein
MRKLALFSLFALLLVSPGCNSTKSIVVNITSPTGAQALDIGQSFNISVTVNNDKLNKGATFKLTGVGTLTNVTTTGATFTATVSGTATVTITSVADPTKTATINIVVTAAPTITSPATLPAATQGTAYNVTIAETGGAGTLTYTVSVGSLPTGLSLSSSGTITGTATGPNGPVTFTIKVTDSSTVSPQSNTQTFTITVNQAPAITSANSAAFTAGAAGSFTVTSTGSPTPALAETGALPAGVTFVDNGNGTGTLSGTAATTGTYAITFKASNGVGTNATQSFTLTIGQAPAITSATSTTFTVGTAGSFTVTTTGFPTPSLSETGALPTGVTFVDNKNGTATLSGTPAAGTGKTYSLSITANNGIGTNAMQTFTLTVDQAPAITSANSTTFTVGTAGTFSVTTTGFPTPSLSETGTLPNGVGFTDNGNGTATLAGTPAAGTGGTYALTIKAQNGIGTNASQSFTLTVGQAPAITSGNSTTFTVGTAGTFSVTTTGFPTPSLTETVALPSGVTFTDNGNGTATLAGTPAAGTGGTYALSIKAHNGIGTDATQSFTLTVDQAPAITSATSTTFSVGGAGTFSVTTTGFPTPALTETGALPTGVTFKDNGNGTATLAGTPAAGTAGTYPLTLKASNGVGSNATQTFTLTVDTAPVITSASSTTFTVGSPGTFTVTTTGTPTPSITGTGALPSGVTFTDNGNGTATLAGTPAAGTGGTYSLSIKAQNGVGTNATQTFTLTVDQAPAITSANNTAFTVGAAGTFTVTTTGYPEPALTETGALPSGVTFTDNGNGTATLAGTPAAGTAGTYPITLIANNGVGSNGTQGFTLTINAAPVAVGITTTSPLTGATQGSSYSASVTASGGVTPYTWTLATGSNLPTGLTLTSGTPTATISGTPTATGTFQFTLKVTDSTTPTAQTATATFLVTVTGSSTFTCPSPVNLTLCGTYVFGIRGFDGAGKTIVFGVSFVADNLGNIISGTEAANGATNGYSTTTITGGSYVMDTSGDGRGVLTLINSTAAAATFRFTLESAANAGPEPIEEFDSTGILAEGVLVGPETTPLPQVPAGTVFSLLMDGSNSAGQRVALLGNFAVGATGCDGSSGSFNSQSGETVVSNSAGTVDTALTVTGSCSPVDTSTGIGTAQINISGGTPFTSNTLNFEYIEVLSTGGALEGVFFLETDAIGTNQPILSALGTIAIASGTVTSAAVSSQSPFLLGTGATTTGMVTSGADVAAIIRVTSSAAGSFSGVVDENSGGTVTTQGTWPYTAYTVDANGVGTITGTGQKTIHFIIDTNDILYTLDESTQVQEGSMKKQNALDIESVGAPYIMSRLQDSTSVSNNAIHVSGVITPTGTTTSGTFPGTLDVISSAGPFPGVTASGTYSSISSTTGRGTGTATFTDGSSVNVVVYAFRDRKVMILDVTSSNPYFMGLSLQ